MLDWNIVISVFEPNFRRACDLLGSLRPLRKTDYFYVLVMKLDDTKSFLRTLKDWSVNDRPSSPTAFHEPFLSRPCSASRLDFPFGRGNS